MSRHRNVRKINFEDELSDDVYGRSLDDMDYAISPSTEQEFMFNRDVKHQHTLSSFMEEPGADEPNSVHGIEPDDDDAQAAAEPERPRLDPESERKLRICIEKLEDILGDSCHEPTAVQAAIKFNYDVEKAVDYILSGSGKQTFQSSPPSRKPDALLGRKPTDTDIQHITDPCQLKQPTAALSLTKPTVNPLRYSKDNNNTSLKSIKTIPLRSNVFIGDVFAPKLLMGSRLGISSESKQLGKTASHPNEQSMVLPKDGNYSKPSLSSLAKLHSHQMSDTNPQHVTGATSLLSSMKRLTIGDKGKAVSMSTTLASSGGGSLRNISMLKLSQKDNATASKVSAPNDSQCKGPSLKSLSKEYISNQSKHRLVTSSLNSSTPLSGLSPLRDVSKCERLTATRSPPGFEGLQGHLKDTNVVNNASDKTFQRPTDPVTRLLPNSSACGLESGSVVSREADVESYPLHDHSNDIASCAFGDEGARSFENDLRKDPSSFAVVLCSIRFQNCTGKFLLERTQVIDMTSLSFASQNLDLAFTFDTPSPDDVVLAKQKKAFLRDQCR